MQTAVWIAIVRGIRRARNMLTMRVQLSDGLQGCVLHLAVLMVMVSVVGSHVEHRRVTRRRLVRQRHTGQLMVAGQEWSSQHLPPAQKQGKEQHKLMARAFHGACSGCSMINDIAPNANTALRQWSTQGLPHACHICGSCGLTCVRHASPLGGG